MASDPNSLGDGTSDPQRPTAATNNETNNNGSTNNTSHNGIAKTGTKPSTDIDSSDKEKGNGIATPSKKALKKAREKAKKNKRLKENRKARREAEKKKTENQQYETEPPNVDGVGPTIYITGFPVQMVRDIATELENLFGTSFQVAAAELKSPTVTHVGYWEDSVYDKIAVSQQHTRLNLLFARPAPLSLKSSLEHDTKKDSACVVEPPRSTDPNVTNPLDWLFSSGLFAARMAAPTTRNHCTIISDTESLNKLSVIENLLHHRAVARKRNSPFYSVFIHVERLQSIIKNMVKAGYPPRSGLGKLITPKLGVRRHDSEGDGEFFTRKASEYILDVTYMTAQIAAEDIAKHFELEAVCFGSDAGVD